MDDKLKVFWNLDVLVKMCRSKSDGPSLRIEEEEILDKIDVYQTEIEDIKDTGGIDIFTQESSIIVSSSEDVKLQTVVISDIAGRTQVYNVSGRYIQIDLPVSAGIYTVNVIGDKQTRVEKIKLN